MRLTLFFFLAQEVNTDWFYHPLVVGLILLIPGFYLGRVQMQRTKKLDEKAEKTEILSRSDEAIDTAFQAMRDTIKELREDKRELRQELLDQALKASGLLEECHTAYTQLKKLMNE